MKALTSLFILTLSTAQVLVAAEPPLPAEQVEFFNSKVLPILRQQCYECHSHEAGKIKGGLVVDSRDGLRKGGDSGEAVVPGNVEKSLLITSIRWDDPDFQMPTKKKLPDADIATLEQWIKMGAPDPRLAPAGVGTQSEIASKSQIHWGFKPVVSPTPPTVKNTQWAHGELDRFILAKQEARGIKPSPAADKRTLLRRIAYDLTGLPPTPEETKAFMEDPSADAVSRLVDRLLASPHYGERWARYWLDVARYADTTGGAGVNGRDNRYIYGWTYRDYVVNALNEDKPYTDFVREQLAADKLAAQGKTDRRNLAALGFLTIGKRFSNADDEIDDRIDATSRAFMGLTVSCARCHDHKYDPIPTEDYYAWHGIFASTREPELGPLLADPAPTPDFADFEKQIADAEAKICEFEDNEWEKYFEEHYAKFDKYLLAMHEARKGLGGLSVNAFYGTRGLRQVFAQRWEAYLKGDTARGATASAKGAPAPKFDPIFEPWKRLAAIPEADFARRVQEELVALKNGPTLHPEVARVFLECEPPDSLAEAAARYGQVVAGAQRQHREKREALLKEAGAWKLVAPVLADASAEALRQVLHGESSPVSRSRLNFRGELGVQAGGQRGRLEAKVNDIRLNHPGSPARAMAVEDIEKPRNSRVFLRGDRNKPGADAPRRFLTQLGGAPCTDGSGRLDLANAIASEKNPLTARVIVNRVWMHHFGTGLVSTPSDFGLRGDAPTHPELLDWLAAQFMQEGWSLKKLHRLILTSATYQQRSDDVPASRALNPDNTLVWKMNRRRLDVEALRDSLLCAAGTLDGHLGGKPVELLGNDGRRTVYSFINRENVPGLLTTFDFALPEMSSPQRNESTVPTQALFIMNSPWVIDLAKKLAALPVLSAAQGDEERLRILYTRLFQRQPSREDISDAVAFLRQQAAFKPEAPARPDWRYGAGIVTSSKPYGFAEAKQWKNQEWIAFEKAGQVRVSADGGLTGAASASVRRWVSPAEGRVNLSGTLRALKGDVRARVELRRGSETPRELFSWTAGKQGAPTLIEGVEIKPGDFLDFAVVPVGKSAEPYAWAPAIELTEVPGDMPTKHGWDSRAEFAGPPPPAPKGMTPMEKLTHALLMTHEFCYVN